MKSVTWSIPEVDDPDGNGDLTAADNMDWMLFDINKSSGELTFIDAPRLRGLRRVQMAARTPEYNLVVAASDGTRRRGTIGGGWWRSPTRRRRRRRV